MLFFTRCGQALNLKANLTLSRASEDQTHDLLNMCSLFLSQILQDNWNQNLTSCASVVLLGFYLKS